MTLISTDQLKSFAPRCDATTIAPTLDSAAQHFGITDNRHIAHWLSQLSAESGGFTKLSENLNYSAERLTQVWPHLFPTLASAQPLAGNPQALANKVYGGRYGNIGLNDGWLYRGGGWIELTFKANYQDGATWSGLDLVNHPELIRTPQGASMTAAGFWIAKGLNKIVDADPGEKPFALFKLIKDEVLTNELDDVKLARRKVNGGDNGLQDAISALEKARCIWSH